MARTKKTKAPSTDPALAQSLLPNREAFAAMRAAAEAEALKAAIRKEIAFRVEKPAPDGVDRLTALHPQQLEEIFADVYSSPPFPGPICKSLLPLQRSLYRTLGHKDRSGGKTSDEHVKDLLSSTLFLERLHLTRISNSSQQLPLLARLPHPELLTALEMRLGDPYYGSDEEGEEEEDEEVEEAGEEEVEEEVQGNAGGVAEDVAPRGTASQQRTTSNLGTTPHRRSTKPPTLSVFLSRCPNLTSLGLEGHQVRFDDTLLATLRSLPHLSHLTIGGGTGISYRTLKSLVTGSKRLPHLRHLTLDLFSSPEGGFDAADCLGEPYDFEESWGIFHEFEWPASLSSAQAQALVTYGSRRGLKLDGEVRETLRLRQRYEEEARQHKRGQRSLRGRGNRYDSEDGYSS